MDKPFVQTPNLNPVEKISGLGAEKKEAVKAPEISKSPETAPAPQPVSTSGKDDTNQAPAQSNGGMHIIDKTKEKTKIHHLEHPLDKLTSIADTEEEDFIEEVEAAHGYK